MKHTGEEGKKTGQLIESRGAEEDKGGGIGGGGGLLILFFSPPFLC